MNLENELARHAFCPISSTRLQTSLAASWQELDHYNSVLLLCCPSCSKVGRERCMQRWFSRHIQVLCMGLPRFKPFRASGDDKSNLWLHSAVAASLKIGCRWEACVPYVFQEYFVRSGGVGASRNMFWFGSMERAPWLALL